MRLIKAVAIIFALAACAGAQQRGKVIANRAALAADSSPRKGAKAAGLEEVDRIFEKFVEAQGGQQAMSRIRSRVMRGSIEHSKSSIPGTVEFYSKAPNKSLAVIDVPNVGQFIEGFDGRFTWLQTPIAGAVALDRPVVVLDRGSEFGRMPKASEMYASVSYKGKTRVEGREAHLIQAAKKGETPQLLYFDVKDGLLLRADVVLMNPDAEGVHASIIFDSYAQVDGVKLPVVFRQIYPAFTLTTKIYEVKHNVRLEDTLFNKPE